jgi:hypothetical protein
MRDFARLLERIASPKGRRLMEVFRSTLELAMLATLGDRAKLEEERGRWSAEDLGVMSEALKVLGNVMEADPFTDFLGPFYMEHGSKGDRDWGGEFYTPKPVCLMTAKLTLSAADFSEASARPLRMLEPACGSGTMILAAAQVLKDDFGVSPSLMRWDAWDISRTACTMTYLNCTLWGIPVRVFHGDTLRLKVHHAWRNPFYPAHEALAADMRETLDATPAPLAIPSHPPTPKPERAKATQPSLFEEV